MLVASPLAPIGPLHDLDPAQGVHLDVHRRGRRRRGARRAPLPRDRRPRLRAAGDRPARLERPSRVTAAAQRPSSLAGLSLARAQPPAGGRAPRAGHDGRRRAPRRRGDRGGVQPRGRGRPAALRRGLRRARLQLVRRPDRRGHRAGLRWPGGHRRPRATRATRCSWTGGRSPVSASRRSAGRAARRCSRGSRCATTTRWCSGSTPPIASGSASATRSQVQAGTAYSGGPPPPPLSLRVVGLATFAAISQQGDGRGAARRRRARHPTHLRAAARLRREPARVDHGEPGRRAPTRRSSSTPTPTASRTRSGSRPGGSPMRDPPSSCSSTRPRRCSPVPSPSRSCCSSPCSPRAPGRAPEPAPPSCRCSRPSGAPAPSSPRTAAWQPVPPGLAALVIGVPLGIAVGRLAFSAFARSIAVVDDPSSPPWLVVALALAVVASVGAGALRGRPGRAPRRRAPPPSATPKAAAPDDRGLGRVTERLPGASDPSDPWQAPCALRPGSAAPDHGRGACGSAVGPGLGREGGRVEAVDELGHRHRLARLGQAEARRQAAADLVGVDALGGEVGQR